MKKKKILFIMNSLTIGGAQKSLLTILSRMDYSQYDVDLFLLGHEGELMEFLPKEVNLLEKSQNFDIFSKNIRLSPLNFFKRLDFKRFYHSLLYLVKCVYYKLINQLYIGWDQLQYMFDVIDKEYDISIAFMERRTIYFNIDKVKSKNKIGFIHNDYSTYAYDYKYDKKYFQAYNKIATVSKHCRDVLIDIFPEYKEKFVVIKNMVSEKMIKQMADEKLDIQKSEKVMIVTVGRLVEQKGIDYAIDVCKMLVDHGYDVKWYVIGGGEEDKLRKKIQNNNIQENFILAGSQKNPYKWMGKCDVYVQPSRFEGFGITVLEAKLLAKPMVVSDIPEFREQIEDGVNGYIAKDTQMMYNKIIEIIENKNGIKDTFIQNLKQEENIENKEELNKFYEMINE